MPATLTRSRTVQLLERTTSTVGKIDRVNGVIFNVQVLGRVSQNGREYSNPAMSEACKLYEGIEVNIDHPNALRSANARPVGETWGILRNCRVVGDSVRGDLHYLTQHRETPVILERIEKGVSLGLSHNAAGKTTRRGNKTIVESISRVHSVDLVTRPATNKNLFESQGHGAQSSNAAAIARLRSNVGVQEGLCDSPVEDLSSPVSRMSESIKQILISRSYTNRRKLEQIAKLVGVEPDSIVQEAVASQPAWKPATTTKGIMARLR